MCSSKTRAPQLTALSRGFYRNLNSAFSKQTYYGRLCGNFHHGTLNFGVLGTPILTTDKTGLNYLII